MRVRQVLLATWLLALLAHTLFAPEREQVPDPSMHARQVLQGERAPRVSYHDDRPDADSTILLIHGSPGEAANFDQLRAEMAPHYRVLTPDLPGFGSSSRKLSDYSFTGHARDLVALLDSLEVAAVHAVGMSMGGGVALEMARLAPDRVESITLLSSIGLQEYELTGDYWTNHILHGIQVGLVWAIDHVVPHFGLLDSGGLAWSYARNFFDSDQRVLTETIRRWNGPTLILHGARDFLVPVTAARAHAEAIPQADYREYADGSHFLIWTRPEEIAADVDAFVAESRPVAEALGSNSRPLPTPPPIEGAGRWLILIPAALLAIRWVPLAAWWFLPLVGVGAVGPLALVGALASGAVFGAGGRQLLRRESPAREGFKAVMGALGWFAVLYLVGSLVDLRSVVGAVVAALVVGTGALAVRVRTVVGRARLRGAWLRLLRWEYWPSWAIYLPIVPVLAWRSRHSGGFRSALCVNPGVPLGGLIGESKSAILAGVGPRPELPRWTRVEPGPIDRRRAEVLAFAATLPDPGIFVIKPDRGERGAGVRIVRAAEQIDSALREIRIPIVVQEYVGGEEYGVFWFRRPGEARGELLSVAHKAMVSVVGDGHRSLDELFACTDRIVPQLDFHRSRFGSRLAEVIADGEVVQVTELGTHALGATFVAANDLRTDALRDAIDRMMDPEFFDFGRFDLRVESADHLAAGRGLRVIEFNGLSAESADLYDPDNSVHVARAGLLKQWTIAMEIGGARRRAGARPASWGLLLRALLAHGSDRGARGG